MGGHCFKKILMTKDIGSVSASMKLCCDTKQATDEIALFWNTFSDVAELSVLDHAHCFHSINCVSSC